MVSVARIVLTCQGLEKPDESAQHIFHRNISVFQLVADTAKLFFYRVSIIWPDQVGGFVQQPSRVPLILLKVSSRAAISSRILDLAPSSSAISQARMTSMAFSVH